MGVLVLLHAAVETARISLPTVVDARRGKLQHPVCDERLRSWAGRLLKHARVDVEVTGLEVLAGGTGPYVVVSNHQSHYDIPVLYSTLPLSLRMAAKTELFRTPLWGQALRASGFVEINRSSPKAAYRALRSAGQMMREHSLSLFVAPEGTRSADGQLGEFKKGAFDVARITRVPVLPVAIDGTRHVHGKGTRRVTKGCSVRVRVLSPVATEDFSDLGEMATHVRDVIAQALREA